MNPFSAIHSPNMPDVLEELNGTIVLTTYQTGKVILLSSIDKKISQLVRDFQRPMGVAFNGELMAIALQSNVTVFKQSDKLAKTYPKKKDTYDGLYYPTASNLTSFIDTHDICFSKQGLIAVNTAYSCLVKIDGQNSFNPIWTPPFITKFESGDSCHLNGCCTDENENIRYATGFGQTNTPRGWTLNKLTTGFLIDVTTNEILCDNLPMPHSPRVYKNELYVLLSASEELIKVDRTTGEKTTIAKIDGFIRGLSFYKNYAFVGVSKLRKSHTFGDLPIAKKKLLAGVVIVDINTGKKVSELLYEGELEEIYDVHFIPNKKRVNIINHPMSQQNPAIITPNYEGWIQEKEQKKDESNTKEEEKINA